MIKSWGIYVRYGKIRMTKNVGCLLHATKRYNEIMKRKNKSKILLALVPIYDV